jgi:hypothetical protein
MQKKENITRSILLLLYTDSACPRQALAPTTIADSGWDTGPDGF